MSFAIKSLTKSLVKVTSCAGCRVISFISRWMFLKMVVVEISMLYWPQWSNHHFSLSEAESTPCPWAQLAFFMRSKLSTIESWQLLSRQDQNRNLPRVDSGDGLLLMKKMLKQVLWNLKKNIKRLRLEAFKPGILQKFCHYPCDLVCCCSKPVQDSFEAAFFSGLFQSLWQKSGVGFVKFRDKAMEHGEQATDRALGGSGRLHCFCNLFVLSVTSSPLLWLKTHSLHRCHLRNWLDEEFVSTWLMCAPCQLCDWVSAKLWALEWWVISILWSHASFQLEPETTSQLSQCKIVSTWMMSHFHFVSPCLPQV